MTEKQGVSSVKSNPMALNDGVSVIRYVDHRQRPMERRASHPKRVAICSTIDDYNDVSHQIQDSLLDGAYWVIATSYEWGVSQLGMAQAHPTAIFMQYDHVDIQPVDHHAMPVAWPNITLTPSWDAAQFCHAVRMAQAAIREGDVYQLNISYPSTVSSDATLERLFYAMVHAHAPRYGAYVQARPWTIASCSPEEFFYYHEGRIRTQPIKGTTGRFSDFKQDERARQSLNNSEKDRAELVMITDLMRHDLGACAVDGSVSTTQLCEMVPFKYVYHLMSTVTATVQPSLTPWDVFQSMVPGGSITGCPKRSACQHIRAIESGPRRFYTGHIGFIHGTTEAAFSVAIRTAYRYHNDPIMVHSGCGITIESDPMDEYQESIDKQGFLMP